MGSSVFHILGNNNQYFKNGKVETKERTKTSESSFDKTLKETMNNNNKKDSVELTSGGELYEMYLQSTGKLAVFDYARFHEATKDITPGWKDARPSSYAKEHMRADGKMYLGKEVKNPIDYETFIHLVNKGEVVNPDWAIPEDKLPANDIIMQSKSEFQFFRKALTLGLFDENGNIIGQELYDKLKSSKL